MDERESLEGEPSRPAPYPPPNLPAGAQVRPPKNPGVALLLSMLMPGIGQIYNAQPAKGLVFFFGFAGAIIFASEVHEVFFGILIPFVYFWNLIDAYRSAALINSRAAGGVAPPEEDLKVESPAWGGTLVVVGLLLLLHNLGWLRLYAVGRYWPLLLIIAGGVLLYRAVQRRGTGSGRGF